jgi:hypothetical protein
MAPVLGVAWMSGLDRHAMVMRSRVQTGAVDLLMVHDDRIGPDRPAAERVPSRLLALLTALLVAL